MPGMNTRLDEIHAAILRVKLKYLAKDNKRRQDIAKIYNENLRKVGLPQVSAGVEHVYHQYVIRVKDRNLFQKYLGDHGIMTAIHYPVPVHLQDAYAGKVLAGDLRVTEEIMPEIVSLPVYPQLEIEDVNYIFSVVKDYYKC